MKKVIFVCVLAVLLLTLAACRQPTPEHTHTYGEWSVVTAPGCETAGEEKRTCACGESETRPVAATGHTPGAGLACSACGKVQYSEGLSYTENSDGTLTLAGLGSCTDTVLRVPATHEGKTVTAVAEGAFEDQAALTGILLPDTVTTIGSSAFYGCLGLVEMTLPASLTSISRMAFGSCRNLTSITVPASLATVQIEAFTRCDSLVNVYISDLSAWCAIEFLGLASNPLARNGKLYVNGALVTDLVIPDGVTKILANAFYGCSSIMSVTMPSGVTEIGNSAFYDCEGITTVTFSDHITYIGASAFGGCRALSSVALPASLEGIAAGAFSRCVALSSVTFREGITEIGARAFSDCKSLRSIELPEGIDEMGIALLTGCDALTAVLVPSSVRFIDVDVLSECPALTAVYYNGTAAKWSEMGFADKESFPTALVHYYSESAPTAAGSYWHYVDGVPTAW